MFASTEEEKTWGSISEDTLDNILEKSKKATQLIYKHSNRCGVCMFTKREIESVAGDIAEEGDLYFIEVNRQRPLSNRIASELKVQHESPQLICVEDGKAVWHFSHNSIESKRIMERLES